MSLLQTKGVGMCGFYRWYVEGEKKMKLKEEKKESEANEEGEKKVSVILVDLIPHNLIRMASRIKYQPSLDSVWVHFAGCGKTC